MHFNQKLNQLLCLWLLTMTTVKSLPRNHNLLHETETPNETKNDALSIEENLVKMPHKYIIPPVIPEEDISSSSDVVFDHVDFETEDAETDDTEVIPKMKQRRVYSVPYKTKFNNTTENQVQSQNFYNDVKGTTKKVMDIFEEATTASSSLAFKPKSDVNIRQIFETEYLEPRTASSNIEALDENSSHNRDFYLLGESVTNFEDITQKPISNENNDIVLDKEIFSSDNKDTSTSYDFHANNFEKVTLTVPYTVDERNGDNFIKNFESTASDENFISLIDTTTEPITFITENSFDSNENYFQSTTPNVANSDENVEEIKAQKINQQEQNIILNMIPESSLTTLRELTTEFQTANSIQTTTASDIPNTTLPPIKTSLNSAAEPAQEGFIANILSALTRLIGLNERDSQQPSSDNTKNSLETPLNLLPFLNNNFTQPALYLSPLNFSALNQTKRVIGYGVLIIPKNFTYLLKPWNITTKEAPSTLQKNNAKYGKFRQFKAAADDNPLPKHLYFGNFNGTVLLNSTFWKPWNHGKFKFYNATSNGLQPFSLFLPLKKQYFLQLQQQQQQQRAKQNHLMDADQNENMKLIPLAATTVPPLALEREDVSVAVLQHEKKNVLQLELEMPNSLIQLYRSIFGASLV